MNAVSLLGNPPRTKVPPDNSLTYKSFCYYYCYSSYYYRCYCYCCCFGIPTGTNRWHKILKIGKCKQLRRRVIQWVKYFGRRPHSPSAEPWTSAAGKNMLFPQCILWPWWYACIFSESATCRLFQWQWRRTVMKGSVQKQHNRGYAVFGPVRDLGIFIDFYYVWNLSL